MVSQWHLLVVADPAFLYATSRQTYPSLLPTFELTCRLYSC